MTKGEMIAAMQGLTDECPIIARVGFQWMEVADLRYGIAQDNSGLLVAFTGDRVQAPKRVTVRESVTP